MRLHFACPKCLEPALHSANPKCPQHAIALGQSEVPAARVCTSPVRSARSMRLHFANPKCPQHAIVLRLSEVPASRVCTSPVRSGCNQRPHSANPKCPQPASAPRQSEVPTARVCTSPIRSGWDPRRTRPIRSAHSKHLHFAYPKWLGPTPHSANPKCPQHASAFRVSEVPGTHAALRQSEVPAARVCTSPVRSAWNPRLYSAMPATRVCTSSIRSAWNPRCTSDNPNCPQHAIALRQSQVPAARDRISPIRSAGKRCLHFAKRVLDERYGACKDDSGPGSELNTVRKWGDGAIVDP